MRESLNKENKRETVRSVEFYGVCGGIPGGAGGAGVGIHPRPGRGRGGAGADAHVPGSQPAARERDHPPRHQGKRARLSSRAREAATTRRRPQARLWILPLPYFPTRHGLWLMMSDVTLPPRADADVPAARISRQVSELHYTLQPHSPRSSSPMTKWMSWLGLAPERPVSNPTFA